ncbi:MAG: hypothetical protein LBR15_07780 [Methanobrevibacter sp.]|jgi:hypothetical protein|nr:hypothetical protein [Candidatus Methanovirga australis]
MISSLGNVSATDVGLWMSAMNNPGAYNTYNYFAVDNANGYYLNSRGEECIVGLGARCDFANPYYKSNGGIHLY